MFKRLTRPGLTFLIRESNLYILWIFKEFKEDYYFTFIVNNFWKGFLFDLKSFIVSILLSNQDRTGRTGRTGHFPSGPKSIFGPEHNGF